MVPFYIYYSMFGFQRVWDLIWAAGDMRVRGFLLGGTAGRKPSMERASTPGWTQPSLQLPHQILNLMTVPMHTK